MPDQNPARRLAPRLPLGGKVTLVGCTPPLRGPPIGATGSPLGVAAWSGPCGRVPAVTTRLRAAVLGAGPSGFYTAGMLLDRESPSMWRGCSCSTRQRSRSPTQPITPLRRLPMPRSARSCSWGAADSLKRRSRLREYSRGVPGGRQRRVILSFFARRSRSSARIAWRASDWRSMRSFRTTKATSRVATGAVETTAVPGARNTLRSRQIGRCRRIVKPPNAQGRKTCSSLRPCPPGRTSRRRA